MPFSGTDIFPIGAYQLSINQSRLGVSGTDYQPLFLYQTSTYTTALALPAAVAGSSVPTSLDGGGVYLRPYYFAPYQQGLTALGRGKGMTLYIGGTGADNSTINFQVIAWQKVMAAKVLDNNKTADLQGAITEYRPMLLWRGQATLSAVTGVSGGLGTSTRIADTITETTAVAGAGWTSVLRSPADDATPASITLYGSTQQFDGFTIDTDLGTATAAAPLVQFIL